MVFLPYHHKPSSYLRVQCAGGAHPHRATAPVLFFPHLPPGRKLPAHFTTPTDSSTRSRNISFQIWRQHNSELLCAQESGTGTDGSTSNNTKIATPPSPFLHRHCHRRHRHRHRRRRHCKLPSATPVTCHLAHSCRTISRHRV